MIHGRKLDDTNADFYEQLGSNPDFFFTLQLIPELADLIVKFDRVCFLDAHVGPEEGEIGWQELQPNFEPSTLSHHLTPQFLLDIAQSCHKRCPQAILVSIRGYEFSFIQGLTPQTHSLAEQALVKLLEWYSAE